ncbi:MAG: AMP-binding protein [bacterium]|nr:AMP-binding protein [bacterium]
MFPETINQSLFQLLLKNEKEAADSVYLKQPKKGVWHKLTWSEVMNQARKVAGFLQHLGLEQGSHVSIISKNCAEWFITDFGIHLAGMVNVPLFPNQHEESIHYILNHAEIKLVFIGKLDNALQIRGFIPQQYPTVSFDYHQDLKTTYKWSEIQRGEPLNILEEPAPEAIYTIIYSSGTTGSPKGAVYTNQSIANYLSIIPPDLRKISDLPHYSLVSYLPLAHVYERSAIQLVSLTVPSDVSFIESLDKFEENLQEIESTLFAAVPRIWGVFQQKIEQKIPPILLKVLLNIPYISTLIRKKIIHSLGFNQCTNYFSGASHLPLSIMKFFEQLGITIQEGYGQTENMAYATLAQRNDIKPGYVGTARLEVLIKLSEEGELLINSPCLMRGYYKEEQASKDSFTAEGWLRTGDTAEMDTHHRVKILGRISENFKNQSGEYITPSLIEKKFESKGIIEQLCLVGKGLPHNVLLVMLSAAALAKDKQEIINQLQECLKKVNRQLAKYEKISNIIVVNDIWSTDNDLLTPTLKVKRKVVEQYYAKIIEKALEQKKTIIMQ